MSDNSEKREGERAAPPGRVAGVLVTHGRLGSELLTAAETIIGTISHVAAVSIGWHDEIGRAHV